MTNIEMKVEGNKLILIVDLAQRHGVTKSGKSVTIATTQGNQKLAGKHADVSFGLNVYAKHGGTDGEGSTRDRSEQRAR